MSVPKTGTTAYAVALASRADMMISDPSMLKHAPVYRYNRFLRPMFKNVCGVEMELMAVMREPVSWLGSWYRYRRRPFMEGKKNSTHHVTFDEFVLAYMKGNKPDFADVGSQANFMKAQPNGTAITHYFRYENQARLTGFLEERLEVKISLTHENVSPAMELTLDPDVERRFKRKFAGEFELYEAIP